MHKPLALGLGAVVLAGTLLAGAAPAAAAQAGGLAATIALNNCSGALCDTRPHSTATGR
jgi:hypothetical protein